MISDSTPPFPIPAPEPSWFAQMMPQSGREGAGYVVAIVIAGIGIAMMLYAAARVWNYFADRRRLKAMREATDTPETDEAVAKWAVHGGANDIIECSRSLERRLAKELDDNRGAKVAFHLTCLDRDAAKKALSNRDHELFAANTVAEEMRTGRMECASQLESAHAELGRSTDEPDANGSVYAQLRWWKDRTDGLHDTIDELNAEIARLRRAREE